MLLRTWALFCIVDHGISKEKVDTISAESTRFSSLPDDGEGQGALQLGTQRRMGEECAGMTLNRSWGREKILPNAIWSEHGGKVASGVRATWLQREGDEVHAPCPRSQ